MLRNENQIYIWLNHINPTANIDPKRFQDQNLTPPKGITFIDIVPIVRTYAKEGYLYKEEVDKIFNSIFSTIKGR